MASASARWPKAGQYIFNCTFSVCFVSGNLLQPHSTFTDSSVMSCKRDKEARGVCAHTCKEKHKCARVHTHKHTNIPTVSSHSGVSQCSSELIKQHNIFELSFILHQHEKVKYPQPFRIFLKSMSCIHHYYHLTVSRHLHNVCIASDCKCCDTHCFMSSAFNSFNF